VDGTTALGEVSDLIGFELPEGDYDTIAGMAVSILEYIPQPDEHPVVRVKNAVFTVLEVEDRRISKLQIEILPEEELSDEAAEAESSRRERD
jgi:putative hemolysin